MNRLLSRFAAGMAIGGVGILLLSIACYAAGARINTTPSIAQGLYWVNSKPVKKGDYVFFCPPPLVVFDIAKERGFLGAGFCPGGYGYMMKRVLAAENDAITVADDGVRVNGTLLPFSAVFKVDGQGRPLPRYQADSYTLNEHQLLLMTDVSPLSFDSRYFGPINRSQIKTVISAVLTW